MNDSDSEDEDIDKYSIDTTYSTNGDGIWHKHHTHPQCKYKMVLDGRCQGSAGHKGNHWLYKPDGSYAWHENSDDPDANHFKNAVCGWSPPDCKGYVNPVDKFKEFFRFFCEDSTVTDPEKIQKLENGELEDGEKAFINTPCTPEEIEWLKQSGRLAGLPDDDEDR